MSESNSTLYDYDGSGNLIYQGKVAGGKITDTSLPIWQIFKFVWVGGNMTQKLIAKGANSFDNIWDNRATTVVYS